MPEAQWNVIEARSGSAVIRLPEASLILVAEVISPSTKSTDLGEKRSEYADRGINEYWLIDPVKKVVLVLTLVGGKYQEGIFTGNSVIISLTFPNLALTAAQVLTTS